MRIFSTLFDDVYQDVKYVSTIGAPVVNEADTRLSFGLAAMFGERILVPARFLIDHGPFIQLCESPSWRDLAFDLVRPVTAESSWSDFLDNCGGTPTREPVYMSSEGGRWNNEIFQAWDNGHGYLHSRRLFCQRYPKAVQIVEELKRSNIRPLSFHPSAGYSYYLGRRLKYLDPQTTPYIPEKLFTASKRGDAFKILESNEYDISETLRESLMAIAIHAKHDEVRVSLGANHVDSLIATPRLMDSTDVSLYDQMELPAIAGIMSNTYTVETLRAIMSAPKVIDLQKEFENAHLFRTVAFIPALKKLCFEAANVVGTKTGRSMANCFIATGGAAIGAAPAMQGIWQLAFLFLGGVAFLGGMMLPGSSAWNHIQYHRRCYKDLLKAAQARY